MTARRAGKVRTSRLTIHRAAVPLGQPGAVGFDESCQVRADRRREEGGAGRGDDWRQGAVVVEDHDETGAIPELPVETVEEAHGETQDAFAPVDSTGILASSLSKSP